MAERIISVRMHDDESYDIVKTILAYESVLRGRRLGQTLAELVMEAAEFDSYPDEVIDRLRAISDAAESKAIERFLSKTAI